MIRGNSRCPDLRLNASAAKAQNCAGTITPKMLTQTKNAKPIRVPDRATAAKITMFAAKNRITARKSRAPSRRLRTRL